MKRTIGAALAALAMMVGGAAAAGAQQAGGTISGKVTDTRTNAPVGDALVSAMSGGRVTTTRSAADGAYRLANLEAGTYTVTAGKIGQGSGRAEGLVMTPGGALTVDLAINTVTPTLTATVVTASRQDETALRAPAAISVVSEQAIAARPSATVTDHLGMVPGVAINKSNIMGANIVSRGFNNAFSGTMLMLQDYRFAGVPSLRVNVPSLFTATNEDIDHIEVLLGPAAALYGPNATSGVLHVITKSPFAWQGTSIAVDGGTRSFARASARTAHVFGNGRVGVKLSGEQFYANDWQYRDPAEPTTVTRPGSTTAVPNERDFANRRLAGEARVDLRPTDKLDLITTFGMTRLGSGIELTAANGTGQIRNWTYTSLQQRVQYGRLFAQAFVNTSNAGNDDSTDTEGTFLLRSGQPIVDKSSIVAVQIKHGYAWSAKQDFTYGLDYVKTTPKTGNTINGRNEDRDNVTETGGYVQSTTNITSKWDLIGAARLDKNDRVEGTQFSPRAAVVYNRSPLENIRATYNRAFSSPSNFSMFLDLNRSQSGPYTVRAVGNPPETGWTFNRTCDAAVSGGLCMKSIFLGAGANTFVNSEASQTLPGLIGNPTTQAGLVAKFTPQVEAILISRGTPPATAAQQAPAIAGQLAGYLATLRPTAADIGTRIRYANDSTTRERAPSSITDIAPLKPSYNTTYELGYKRIMRDASGKDRASLAVNVWHEIRGDVGVPAEVATPSVFADSTTMVAYFAAALTPAVTPVAGSAAAPAVALDAAKQLAAQFMVVPLGMITFNDTAFAKPNFIYATYRSSTQEVKVNGADVALDYVLTPRIRLAGTASWVSQLVFNDVTSSNDLPLMLNAPDRRGAVSALYHDDRAGWSVEGRARYFAAYPVNSGVYATDHTFKDGPGTPPSEYTYEPVKASTTFDALASMRLPFRAAQLSINAENLFNQPYRTFPGVPTLGRLITSRLRFDF
jgi:outer membrane receptor for ferrienterochelin and colicins